LKIQVQITVQSEEGKTEVIQEVARLERGPLRPDTLGLSLAEARPILAGVEQPIAEGQVAQVCGPGLLQAKRLSTAVASLGDFKRLTVGTFCFSEVTQPPNLSRIPACRGFTGKKLPVETQSYLLCTTRSYGAMV